MPLAVHSSLTPVKVNVAGILREEMMSARLKPGDPIVEGKWAAKLKVARASVREAINILWAEGFVQKGLARSARVTAFSQEDVVQIYETRVALEGMAARLVATRKPDLSELDQLVADMRSAAQCENVRTFRERDLSFHLLICEKSGNRFLLEHIRELLVPFFAFVVLRRKSAMGDLNRDCEEHRRILEAIRSGDPDSAQRDVTTILQRFSEHTAGPLIQTRAGIRANATVPRGYPRK
jgi:DNA-binding GntR family transcriptional regulator